MKRRWLPLLLAAGTLLLAGCKFQATTQVQGNGRGELRTEVGFTAEERQNLEKQNSAQPQDFCNTSGQSSPGVSVTEEQRGDETWCITTTRFKDLEQLRGLYLQKKGLTINRLEISADRFYYDLDIDTSSQDSSFSGFSAITWSVILPGAPLEHNATQADGKTLTWTIAPKSGQVHLEAQSEVEQAAPALPATIGIILAVLGIAALALVLLRRGARR
jgi:hypothetical protein